jgi:homoaconitase/3-isopropylmalate dehydratase large subunit
VVTVVVSESTDPVAESELSGMDNDSTAVEDESAMFDTDESLIEYVEDDSIGKSVDDVNRLESVLADGSAVIEESVSIDINSA